MLIVTLYRRSLLSGIHHAYQVKSSHLYLYISKGTVGGGNTIWIRVYCPESYTLKNAGLFQPNFGSNMD